jgi:hypothetical protein
MSRIGLPARSEVGAPLPNPTGQSPRAAVPVSQARAEASRRNGAKSRGPRTPEGKERSSRNALKHGLRAQKHVVLPQEDGAEFARFQAALLEELAPVRPHRNPSPLPLLDHFGVGLLDQTSDPSERLAPPITQLLDFRIYQLRGRVSSFSFLRAALAVLHDCCRLLHTRAGSRTMGESRSSMP